MTTFLQNNWYGGETNDKYIATGQGQFLEGRSINISKASKYFYNANGYFPIPTFTYDVGGFSTRNIRQLLLGESANRLIFFSGGQINNLFGIVTTLSKGIINAGVVGNKGFIICSNGSIDTWTYNAQASDLGLSTLSANTITGLSVSANFAPFLNDNIYLHIGSANKYYTILLAGFLLINTVELPPGGVVRGLSKIGDQYNIYTNYGNNSSQFIHQLLEEQYTYEIKWTDKTILNIATINNIDYVFCEDGLYIVNGYQQQCLYQRFFISEYTNAIETYKNKIFIPGYGCVYSYEFNKPGFPGSFCTELILPITEGVEQVSCMTIGQKTFDSNFGNYVRDIIICYNNFSLENYYKNYIIFYSNYRYSDTRNRIGGSVKLNPIIGLKGTLKTSKKIRIGYNLYNSNLFASNEYKYGNITKIFHFKHSIGVFAEIGQKTRITCYIGGFVIAPSLGSIYNIQGNNGEVKNISNLFLNEGVYSGWIEFEMTDNTNFRELERNIFSITKVSGVGDDSGLALSLHIGKIVIVLNTNIMNGKGIMFPGEFDEISFTIHITEGRMGNNYDNERLQTRVYDFAFLYDEIQNDLI